MAKATAPKPPRGTGPHGNGAKPLEIDSLRVAGLSVIRILTTTPDLVKGQFRAPVEVHELVVPTSELPRWDGPTIAPNWCNACRDTQFRLNAARDGWACVRCHPEVTA